MRFIYKQFFSIIQYQTIFFAISKNLRENSTFPKHRRSKQSSKASFSHPRLHRTKLYRLIVDVASKTMRQRVAYRWCSNGGLQLIVIREPEIARGNSDNRRGSLLRGKEKESVVEWLKRKMLYIGGSVARQREIRCIGEKTIVLTFRICFWSFGGMNVALSRDIASFIFYYTISFWSFYYSKVRTCIIYSIRSHFPLDYNINQSNIFRIRIHLYIIPKAHTCPAIRY